MKAANGIRSLLESQKSMFGNTERDDWEAADWATEAEESGSEHAIFEMGNALVAEGVLEKNPYKPGKKNRIAGVLTKAELKQQIDMERDVGNACGWNGAAEALGIMWMGYKLRLEGERTREYSCIHNMMSMSGQFSDGSWKMVNNGTKTVKSVELTNLLGHVAYVERIDGFGLSKEEADEVLFTLDVDRGA